jgi:hypothetical protein
MSDPRTISRCSRATWNSSPAGSPDCRRGVIWRWPRSASSSRRRRSSSCGRKRFGTCDEDGRRTRCRPLPRARRHAARSREVVSVRGRPEGDPAPRRAIRRPSRSPRPAGGIDDRDTIVLIRVAPKLVSCIVAIAVAISSTAPSAREYRSREVTREFQREHPCPSTGRTSGACPGYRKDHIKPLACGGPDAVWNLQWQTIADAKAKDRWGRRACGR